MVICAKTPSDSEAVYTFLQTKYTQLQCFRRLIQTFTVFRGGRRTVTSGFQFRVTEFPSWRSQSLNTHRVLELWAPSRQEFRAPRTDCASVTHRVGEGVHSLQAPSEMFCLQDLTELQGTGRVWYGYDTHSSLFSCSCCRLWRKISLITLPPSARIASLIFISSFFASKAFALFKIWRVWSLSYESHKTQLHIWFIY